MIRTLTAAIAVATLPALAEWGGVIHIGYAWALAPLYVPLVLLWAGAYLSCMKALFTARKDATNDTPPG